jgi:uncharacterized protein
MRLNKFLSATALLFILLACDQLKFKPQIKDAGIPKPIGYVSDFEGIYTPGETIILDSMINDFEEKTTIEIGIITIDTSMVKEKDFDGWVGKVANTWGIGKKNKNNGILVGISKGYRRMRIQNGYGIEKNLSDQETKAIIDNDFIPFFKDAGYFKGTVNGLHALMKKFE